MSIDTDRLFTAERGLPTTRPTMREFSADYLDRTRRGMWADSRAALAGLDLPNRSRVLDVGCGTGEFTRVLAAEATDATVVGVDADPSLLRVARENGAGESVAAYVAGDAGRLPFPDDSFDLVACQALLVNLADPEPYVREFARVSSDLVAAVEPDNADVSVSSTVDDEADLAATARRAFIDGAESDVAGGGARAALAAAGLSDRSTRRYRHETRIVPPYSEADLRGASRKATAAALSDHETELRRTLSEEGYDSLRSRWREMGRTVVEQMAADDYRRVEVVPFDVTVGRVGDA